MSTNFGAPQQSEDVAVGGQAGGTQEAAVDPNDPRLTSESLENAEGDAYKQPDPPPDGIWRAKLKLSRIKDAAGVEQDYKAWSHPNVDGGTPMFVAAVEACLIDLKGTFDGVKVTDGFVKSNVDKKKGISQMSTIITRAGGTVPSPSTDRSRADALVKVLAGEPEALVETAWEASCQACGEAAKKTGSKRPRPFKSRMRDFPSLKPGVHDANAPCPTCKAICRAQVRIARYYKVGEVKVTHGAA